MAAAYLNRDARELEGGMRLMVTMLEDQLPGAFDTVTVAEPFEGTITADLDRVRGGCFPALLR